MHDMTGSEDYFTISQHFAQEVWYLPATCGAARNGPLFGLGGQEITTLISSGLQESLPKTKGQQGINLHINYCDQALKLGSVVVLRERESS